MIISEVVLNPQTVPDGAPLMFRVGAPVTLPDGTENNDMIVEKITFHPSNNAFNRGREVSSGCYAVFFVDLPERSLIMESTVASIVAAAEKKKKVEAEEVPELPE